MAHWAKPGVRCVCILSDWVTGVALEALGTPSPTKGEICLIDEVVEDGCWIGIAGYPIDYFETKYFRPLITRTQEQDIAIFAPILEIVEEPA